MCIISWQANRAGSILITLLCAVHAMHCCMFLVGLMPLIDLLSMEDECKWPHASCLSGSWALWHPPVWCVTGFLDWPWVKVRGIECTTICLKVYGCQGNRFFAATRKPMSYLYFRLNISRKICSWVYKLKHLKLHMPWKCLLYPPRSSPLPSFQPLPNHPIRFPYKSKHQTMWSTTHPPTSCVCHAITLIMPNGQSHHFFSNHLHV